jgi:hypothetical protein
MGGLFQNSTFTTTSTTAYGANVTPANYSGLFLWLDANDSTTVTASANAISTWSDKSGGGRHFTQATAGSRPTYQTGSFNGLPSVNFDGSSDFLTYSSATSYSRFTIFAVLNIQTNPTMQTQEIFGKKYYYALGTSDFPFSGLYASPVIAGGSSAIGSAIDAGGNYAYEYVVSSSGIFPNTPYLCTSYYDQVNLISSLNGVTKQTISANITLSSTAAPYSIGRAGSENGGGAGASYYKGNIAELIMYTSSLSVAQQKDIRTYLSTKWRLPIF